MTMKQRVRRKAIVDFRLNETTIADTAQPADYSFFGFKKLEPVGLESVRVTRLGFVPERSKEGKKFLTSSVWLNNNKLTSIRGMDTLVESILLNVDSLKWIDFSFNRIRDIDSVILKFPNLTIVNFHGNKIEDITQIAKMGALKVLKNVTFHGNPIEKIVDYRRVIMAYLPKICHLDYSPILRSERFKALHPDAIKYVRSSVTKRKAQIGERQMDRGGAKTILSSTGNGGGATFRSEGFGNGSGVVKSCTCSCSV